MLASENITKIPTPGTMSRYIQALKITNRTVRQIFGLLKFHYRLIVLEEMKFIPWDDYS